MGVKEESDMVFKLDVVHVEGRNCPKREVDII